MENEFTRCTGNIFESVQDMENKFDEKFGGICCHVTRLERIFHAASFFSKVCTFNLESTGSFGVHLCVDSNCFWIIESMDVSRKFFRDTFKREIKLVENSDDYSRRIRGRVGPVQSTRSFKRVKQFRAKPSAALRMVGGSTTRVGDREDGRTTTKPPGKEVAVPGKINSSPQR